MTAAESFDVVILGGGTGGYSCALRAADLGLRTAPVEKEKVGGTCLHRGCIPAKALLQAAEVAEHTADEWCETSVAGVYAIGDVIGRLGLAHSSFQEGFLVAERIAGRPAVPIDYLGVPRVYYCHPEVASVGYTEQQLTEQGIPFERQLHPFSHNARAQMTKSAGHVKVLGVHIVGPRATDIIGEAQLIYNWEALPTEVAQFIHPHPTIVEAIGEAHLAAAGKPLHG